MNFRKENGVTGIDITIAILILTISISIIATLVFQISSNSKNVERKTQATSIAVDTIEKIKLLSYTEVVNNSTSINDIIQEANAQEGYSTSVDIQKYNETAGNTSKLDLVKKITVNVQYKINKDIEKVEISTLITRRSLEDE